VDPKLRDEVQERVKKLDIASYTGFVMPKLDPVLNAEGRISEVRVIYPMDLAKKMLEYSSFTKGEKAAMSKQK